MVDKILFVGVTHDGQEVDLAMDETGLVTDIEGKLDGEAASYELVPVQGGLRLHNVQGGSVFLQKVIPVERSKKSRERAARVLQRFQESVRDLERTVHPPVGSVLNL